MEVLLQIWRILSSTEKLPLIPPLGFVFILAVGTIRLHLHGNSCAAVAAAFSISALLSSAFDICGITNSRRHLY
jgi:hypothetical protein